MGLVPLFLLAFASACRFDSSTGSGNAGSQDAALVDAQLYLDDGALVPDADPSLDAMLPMEPCSIAPFVARPENGHSYYVEASDLIYDQAQASCMSKGGHLVVINDAAEDIFVGSLNVSEPWIGFNDLDIEDNDNGGASFAWVNGENPTYTNWKASEPSDGGGKDEDCVVHKGGLWEDKKCQETRKSVCECDPANTSAPAPACMSDSDYSSILDGRRYRFELIPTIATAARASCAADGASLATIADLTENANISTVSTFGSKWIGLYDPASNGNFVWLSGSASTYRNFDEEEPSSGGSEQCVEMKDDGPWNDENCFELQSFVCECDPLYSP